MREFVLTLVKKENKRRLLAALFLVFFLAEMGSHVVICANNHLSMDEQSISSYEGNHDDPCKTLVLCGDSSRRDKQVPRFAHDASQHNALLDVSSRLLPQLDIHKDPRIPFSSGDRVSRPPDPLFHPPQNS